MSSNLTIGSMRKNWKTTVAGIVVLVTTGLGQFDGLPANLRQWCMLVASVIGGIGLLLAQDGWSPDDPAK